MGRTETPPAKLSACATCRAPFRGARLGIPCHRTWSKRITRAARWGHRALPPLRPRGTVQLHLPLRPRNSHTITRRVPWCGPIAYTEGVDPFLTTAIAPAHYPGALPCGAMGTSRPTAITPAWCGSIAHAITLAHRPWRLATALCTKTVERPANSIRMCLRMTDKTVVTY